MGARTKGKVIERWFVNNGLKKIFPNIRRNAGTQSQAGGVDLENSGPFNIECKGGKTYSWTGVKKMIDQVKEEGRPENWDMVLVRPQEKTGRQWFQEAYAIIPFPDLLEILQVMKKEGII